MEINFTIPRKRPFKNIYQFKITLLDTKPPVWRRILVPESYSFYDLHVAIQDVMGWTDSHLHCFEKRELNNKRYAQPILVIDSPYAVDEIDRKIPTLFVTETPITHIFKNIGDKIIYVYDFGDNWEHDVILEKILTKEPDKKYPICLDGAFACPLEDCGSIPGYYQCIQTLKDKKDTELLDWIGDWNPQYFNPKKIVFNDPRKRFLETQK